MSIDIDQVVQGYLECAVWVGIDWSDDEADETGDRPLDEEYSVDDISEDARIEALRECEEFVTANIADCEASDLAPDYIGHDFCLTRNGHGTGFWDRGLGDLGERLSDAARKYGEADLFPGVDGKLYWR